MRKLAKYDFSKCYGINSMTIHATLNPCNCNIESISYFDNFDFAVAKLQKQSGGESNSSSNMYTLTTFEPHTSNE